jgi:glycosyltransferase involved in cell wall biosynthesis
MMKIGIDLHNLSVDPIAWKKTGVQEVVFQILLGLRHLKSQHFKTDLQFVALPYLPKRSLAPNTTCRPVHLNNSKVVIDQIASALNTPDSILFDSQWPWESEAACEEKFYSIMPTLDWILITGICDFRQIAYKSDHFRFKTRFAVLVHDLISVKYPEVTGKGMNEWFQSAYLKSIKELACLTFSGSINTTLDCLQYLEIEQPDSRSIENHYVRFPNFHRDAGTSEILERLILTNEVFFLCIGTIEPRKNLSMVLEACALAASLPNTPPFKIVFVGKEGWGQSFAPAIETIKSKVLFTGFISDNDVQILLKNSRGLIFPSKYEGFGIPLFFAKNEGISIITCANSSLPEVAEDAAIYVNVNSPQELALAMLKLAQENTHADLKGIFSPTNVKQSLSSNKNPLIYSSWDSFLAYCGEVMQNSTSKDSK